MDEDIEEIVAQRMKAGQHIIKIEGNVDQRTHHLLEQHPLLDQQPVQRRIIVRQKAVPEHREIQQEDRRRGDRYENSFFHRYTARNMLSMAGASNPATSAAPALVKCDIS